MPKKLINFIVQYIELNLIICNSLFKRAFLIFIVNISL
jgi:hypothetical protein